MRGRGYFQRLEERVEQSGEPVYGVPLVEIYGGKRVLIEHHRGVIQYGPEMICVRVRSGEICVQGCGLELARMTKEQLVISGRIQRVCLDQGGEPWD